MVSANEILNTPEQPELALAQQGSGLAPEVIDWKNSIPAWLRVADQELAYKKDLYDKHLKEVEADKAKHAADLNFDMSKVHPLDSDRILGMKDDVLKYWNSNATKIDGKPTSPESLKLNSMIASTLALANQSAQSYAADNKAQEFINARPDLAGEDARAAYEQWRNQPAEKRATSYVNFTPTPTYDLGAIDLKIKKESGLDQVTGDFIGKDPTTGMWKFSDKTQYNPQSLNTAIANNWNAVVPKTGGKTVGEVHTAIFNKSTPDEKLALINSYLTPDEKAQVGLDKIPINQLSEDQKNQIIQRYAPDARTEFVNQAVSAAGGAKTATQYRNDAYALAAMQFDYYKQKTEFAKPIGSEAIDLGLELYNPESPRYKNEDGSYVADNGAAGRFSYPPSPYYSVNNQPIDGFVNKDGKLYAIPQGAIRDFKANKLFNKTYYKLSKDQQAQVNQDRTPEWDNAALIPITDYYSQVYNPYIDFKYKTSGADDKERAAQYASQVDAQNILKVPKPQGKAYEEKKPIGTSTSSGSFSKGNQQNAVPSATREEWKLAGWSDAQIDQAVKLKKIQVK